MNVASRSRSSPLTAAVLLAAAAVLLALVPPPVSAQTPPTDPPARPQGLTGDVTHDMVSLRWDDPGDDIITSYQILRRDADTDAPGVFHVHVDNTGSADNSYVDRDVEPDTRYVYRIKARNAEGLSVQSGYFDANTPAASGSCPDPTPTEVEVEAVPIVVASTTDDYFVLYARSVDQDGWELPVAVVRGQAGTTALAENVEALAPERYRVEKYLVSDPADVDGDCIDDITELGDPANKNPINPAPAIAIADGAVSVPDMATLQALYFDAVGNRQGKFVVAGLGTDRPSVYFMNVNTHRHHSTFVDRVDLEWNEILDGSLVYDPDLTVSGGRGAHYFWMDAEDYTFDVISQVFALLAASMPLIDQDLVLFVPNFVLASAQPALTELRESRIDLVFNDDIFSEVNFLALNPGVGFGRLRSLEPDDRPHPRDIVLYEALPNELPRVAGIVSTVPQTPLSHVNLRAKQDHVPNAFVRNALDKYTVTSLLGDYVRYEVADNSWSVRAATPAEVDAHHASRRPAAVQVPQRDLSVTTIKPLSQVGFSDWDAFGVKAANVAVLRTLGFPQGTVPDGFAVPFYFYDEFMKANSLYNDIDEMLADDDFQNDFDEQADKLKKLRKKIKDADTPQFIIDALTAMHATYPEGQSLRYRSSTNNEDLPGFNGAGLYDSKTQKPDETTEDGIDKSLKQVFASLWNFRAFTEREFHRIDHKAAAMGVLVHPNYTDELANGVAVSFNPVHDDSRYYVNTQLGEDLVTNPQAHSVPEELLLPSGGRYVVLGTSNLVPTGQLLMSADQINQLRRHLRTIHDRFKQLYRPASGESFAMEIEFKITSADKLAIKQARPWVFDIMVDGVNEAPMTVPDEAVILEDTAVIIDVRANDSDPEGDDLAVTVSIGPRVGTATVEADGTVLYTPGIDYHGTETFAYKVSDGHFEVDGAVSVTVHPVNDAPVFAAADTARTVVAGAAANAPVGSPVTASDVDDATLSYTLAGADASLFDIKEGTGQITVAEGAVLVAGDRHTVTVQARDAAGATGRTEVAISVTERVTPPITGGGGGGGGGGGPAPPQSAGFTDVDPAGVHATNIEALFAAGITVGCQREPLRRFCPGQSVTRAQMATFLARALNPETPSGSAGFADVDPAGVHTANIEALFAAGITVGCQREPLRRFCPGQSVTRAQMATFLARALNPETPSGSAGFADVDPAGVHTANIEALFAAGITVGCQREPLRRFCPGQPVTRAQMATFLARALNIEAPS